MKVEVIGNIAATEVKILRNRVEKLVCSVGANLFT